MYIQRERERERCMCIYIYIHTYIHTYISLSLSIYIYIYIYHSSRRPPLTGVPPSRGGGAGGRPAVAYGGAT